MSNLMKIAPGPYVTVLINRPWDRGGLHCWRLVRDVQRDLFGRDLPPVFDTAPDRRATKAEAFADHPERARWREITAPAHGAVALMARKGARPDFVEHAGVWLDIDGGGLLHVDAPHGVVFDSLVELASVRRWATPQFFLPHPLNSYVANAC